MDLSLEIDNQKLEEIPKYFFGLYDCSKYRRLRLDLGNLKVLRHSDLVEFTHLESLELIVNRLTTIEVLNNFKKLKHFILEANNLILIPPRLLINFPCLETLKLVLPKMNELFGKLILRNRLLTKIEIECYSHLELKRFFFTVDLDVLHVTLLKKELLYTNICEEILRYAKNVTDFKTNKFYFGQYANAVNWKFKRLTITDSPIKQPYVNEFFKLPTLTYANISNNSGFNLFDVNLNSKLKSLIYLNLRCNTISKISDQSFRNFTNLQILDLSYNFIEEIQFKKLFKGLKKLRILNLQNNRIRILNVDCFKYLSNLEVLNVANNEFVNRNVFKVCETLPKLKRLTLGWNKLKMFENYKIKVLSVLDVLDLQCNEINDIGENVFWSMKNLRFLYLNDNAIRELHAYHFDSLQSLEYLNLSDNYIDVLDKELFSRLSNLKILKISNNIISYLQDDVFKNLRYLQILDLSHNKITEISSNTFKLNRCIRYLNLSNNQITTMAKDAFLNCQCVNLKNNKLKNSLESINAY